MIYYIISGNSWLNGTYMDTPSHNYRGRFYRMSTIGFRLVKKVKQWHIILFTVIAGASMLGSAAHRFATLTCQTTATEGSASD